MVNIPRWPNIPIWRVPKTQSLNNSFAILDKLGNPQKQLPPTVHIAGTNGKGSSLAMLKGIFLKAGYMVHSYTSPHLLEFNERILLNNNCISDYHLNQLLEETKYAADQLRITPTFFEGTTIAAFLAFQRVRADILLLEVGMGGRLDCTNVIEEPMLTIITSISYDHMDHLGCTLKEIALEKAGIIKPGIPCIIGPQVEEVYDILIEKCNEVGAPSLCYEYDFVSQETSTGFKYCSKNINLDVPLPNLLGNHQILNASMVIAAITALNHQFKITNQKIIEGITNTEWPGRLQRIEKKYSCHLVGDNTQIYIDGAHNVAGAEVLSHWVKHNVTGLVFMILGMTNNRDVLSFCRPFKGIVTQGIAVGVESEPSAYSAKTLATKTKGSGIKFIDSDSLIEAIDHTRKICQQKSTIIITGSLFLMADFFKLAKMEAYLTKD